LKKILFWGIGKVLATLFVVSFVLFFVLRVLPGDPARVVLGMQAGEESVQRFRQEFGLNDSAMVQYFRWLGGLFRGDFGVSFSTRQPVINLIAERLSITLFLTFMGLFLALLFSVPLSVLSSRKPWGLLDRIFLFLSHTLMAFPEFWIGMVLILLFAGNFGLFPLFGSGIGWHLFLPVLALGLNRAPILFRTLRTGLIQEISKPYVVFFLSSGMKKRNLYSFFLIINLIPSLVAVLSIQLGYLLGGAVIIEQLFALPGLGRLLLSALLSRDMPVIQAGILLSAGIFALVGFISDLVNNLVAPRGYHES